MRLLALDTTAEFGSLALLTDNELTEEVPLHSPDGFGHTIFQSIDALLRRHNLTPAQIDCYAAATGPGSFTGVRVGLTAIKGLAEATSRPVVGVSNLKAIATFGTHPGQYRAAFLDARRGEVYAAVYDAALNELQPETVIRFPNWLAQVPPDSEFLAQDFTPFAAALSGRPCTHVPRALAAAIARLAAKDFAAGRALDPAALDANYVRRSDAELLWKEPA